MITENLSTLKINKLSQTQYERELAAGRIDENALYLTPDDGNNEINDALSDHNINTNAHEDIRDELKDKLNTSDITQNTGNRTDKIMSQAAVTAAFENLTTLPYGGSKEWLENNGDITQLYQIDGYVWGYIEADGWTRSGTKFLIVSSESEMTNEGGTKYLLRQGNNGTVYNYTSASGDANVAVVDSIPDTVNNGDIITVNPLEVSSTDEMTDTSKLYAIDGNVWEYGEKTVTVEPSNKFVPSTATLNQRLSGSSASVSSNSGSVGSFVTDFIAVSDIDSISPYIARLNWKIPFSGDNKVVYFNSGKTRLGSTVFASSSAYENNTTISNGETVIDLKTGANSSVDMPSNWADVAYIRLQLFVKPVGTSLTSADIENLTIKFDADKTTTTQGQWSETDYSVGRKYQATVSGSTVTWTDVGAYSEPTEASWDATSETHDVIDSLSSTSHNGDTAVYSADGYLYSYISGSDWMQTSRYSAPTLSIDGELSLTSPNAIQNQAVAAKIKSLQSSINANTENIDYAFEAISKISTGNETVTVPSFWRNAVDEVISKIKALQVGRNCVTFPFFSDNHQRNGYAGVLIAYIMKECNIPYCFFGGDSISSGRATTANTEAEMIEMDKAFDTAMSYIPNGRFCRAVGNHDGYLLPKSEGGDGITVRYNRDQVYDLFLREESIAQNKHFGGEGTYYYVDDIASKVRFIVMDTNNAPVDDAQISWVQNTALSFNESGWAVVFISHQPISNHYHAGITNAAAVVSAVTSTATSKNVPIIGWFSGHVHRDIMTTKRLTGGNGSNAGTEAGDLGFTQVIITSDHTGIAYDDATKHTVANDDQSHAIDFVTINKATRTVNITRLGIGSDRSYTY